MPGNTVVKEMGDELEKLGPDAVDIAERYGDDAIPLLLKYGDDAVNIIDAYGDDGIVLLTKYGDNIVDSLRKTNPAPRPWTEYVPTEYYDDVFGSFNGDAVAIRLTDDITVYRY